MGLKSSEKLKKNLKLAFQVGEENNQLDEIQLSISFYLLRNMLQLAIRYLIIS